jgi:hypothetical protein
MFKKYQEIVFKPQKTIRMENLLCSFVSVLLLLYFDKNFIPSSVLVGKFLVEFFLVGRLVESLIVKRGLVQKFNFLGETKNCSVWKLVD